MCDLVRFCKIWSHIYSASLETKVLYICTWHIAKESKGMHYSGKRAKFKNLLDPAGAIVCIYYIVLHNYIVSCMHEV